jgi:hypothetical protein
MGLVVAAKSHHQVPTRQLDTKRPKLKRRRLQRSAPLGPPHGGGGGVLSTAWSATPLQPAE